MRVLTQTNFVITGQEQVHSGGLPKQNKNGSYVLRRSIMEIDCFAELQGPWAL